MKARIAAAFALAALLGPALAQEAPKDADGTPLPAGAVARLGSTRFRVPTGISSIAYSHDGKAVLVSSGNKLLRIDAVSGKVVGETALTNYASSLAVSADGKTIVASAYDGLTVLDGDGKVRKNLRDGMMRGGNPHVALSPDGKYAVAVPQYQQEFTVWDVEKGTALHRLKGANYNYSFPAIAFTPDGKHSVQLWGDGLLHLVDLASGKSVRSLEADMKPLPNPQGNRVSGVCVTPDGKRVLFRLYGETGVRIHDVATGKEVRKLEPVAGEYSYGNGGAMRVTPDGRFVVESNPRGGVRLWGLASGKILRDVNPPNGSTRVVLSPDGRRAAGYTNNVVLSFDLEAGRIAESGGHNSPVGRMAFSPDGKLLACVDGSTLVVWDVAASKKVASLAYANINSASPFGFTDDGTKLTWSSYDRSRQSWAFRTDTAALVTPGTGAAPPRNFASQAASPDGRYLAGVDSATRKLVVVDLTGKAPERDLGVQANPYGNTLTFSPDGAVLAVASNNDVSLTFFASATGDEIRRHSPEPSPMSYRRVPVIRFSPDSRSYLSLEGSLKLIETFSGVERASFPADAVAGSQLLELSPDGRTAARGMSDGSIALFDAYTGKQTARVAAGPTQINVVAFSRDGKRFATAAQDTTVLVWDVPAPPAAGKVAGLSDDDAWADLESAAAGKGWLAIRHLRASPDEAIKRIKERLKPPPVIDAKVLARWVEELDDDAFAVRDKAARELAAAGRSAEAALRAAAKHPSLEVRRKVEELLKKISGSSSVSPERLRAVRAIEVLEGIGTPAAKETLEAMLKSKIDARLEADVRAALARMK